MPKTGMPIKAYYLLDIDLIPRKTPFEGKTPNSGYMSINEGAPPQGWGTCRPIPAVAVHGATCRCLIVVGLDATTYPTLSSLVVFIYPHMHPISNHTKHLSKKFT